MNTQIISMVNPKSIEAEAYRTLRTNLQFSSADEELKSILVTSANATEGKTTTVCNLAVSFAQIGKKVVIVEGDLRRPRLHHFLNLSNQAGISNVLAQHVPLESVIQTSVLDIDVLTCGAIPPNPAELLNSKRMQQLMDQLRGMYDIIIIDTPPVGVVTDASILSTLVDGTLIVVASHQTESDQLLRAMKLLQNVEARILGSVLTKVPANSKGYYGYQYYDYKLDEVNPRKKRNKSKRRRIK